MKVTRARTPARHLAGLLMLSMAIGCSATPPRKPSIDFDQQFDFSRVRSIYLEPFGRTDPATINVSDRQIAAINGAIEDELRRKDLAVVPESRQADLYLRWNLVIDEQITTGAGNGSGYYDAGESAGSGKYESGTLIVEMIDPIRNRSVWRSVYPSRLRAEPDPEKSDQNRRAAAAAVFAGFPPS